MEMDDEPEIDAHEMVSGLVSGLPESEALERAEAYASELEPTELENASRVSAGRAWFAGDLEALLGLLQAAHEVVTGIESPPCSQLYATGRMMVLQVPATFRADVRRLGRALEGFEVYG